MSIDEIIAFCIEQNCTLKEFQMAAAVAQDREALRNVERLLK